MAGVELLGRLLRGNVRRKLINEKELWTQLRHPGIRSLEEVESGSWKGTGRSATS